ncbi:deubiquitinating protein VCIP135-like isoform X2 [Acanthaster planci]|uniref:ubiquitinyl hydrolase 1 n=1 Tax=Acanthaster planci TaxID=133434 RepID=A0A8B7Z1J7_ACAPL|nr:deubiquitinating protein VCIP135-like isoform X2 [Acanthaster planci]
MTTRTHFSGVFLPVFVPREECCGKDGMLNKPLCIAWSSSGRNHFIALVGVKGRPLPRLPRGMLTKAWGAPHELIDTYIEFDKDDMCTVGGDRSLPDKYVQRLAAAMEEVFVEKYSLHPSVVADVHHYIYKRTGVVGVPQNIIIENTRHALEHQQLFRCLLCSAVSQIEKTSVPSGWLGRGGELYGLATKLHGRLIEGKVYTFPLHELNCTYDAVKDELVPDQSTMRPSQCAWCQGKQLRQIRTDGSVVYFNGDRTTTPAPKTKCNCGFKHYWNGIEYDNNPSIFTVPLKWKGLSYLEEVLWFQDESDPALNSNAYDIASALVQKHFPGEFGSEKLVQQVVETILQNTAGQEEEFQPISLKDMPTTSTADQSAAGFAPAQGGDTPELKRGLKGDAGGHTPKHSRPKDKDGHAGRSASPASGRSSPRVGSPAEKKGGKLDESPSKIILTGHAAKTLHKEELTMSEAERNLRKRIQDKAPVVQHHHPSLEESGKQPSPSTPPSGRAPTQREDVVQGSPQGGPKEEMAKATDIAMETVVQATKEPPKQKRIRLTSSDGKQATLVLDPSTTFAQLQAKIEAEFHIEAADQKIRYGFPPKELTVPAEGDQEDQPVPLQNGDRVTVEVISKVQPMEVGPSEHGQHSLSTLPGSSTLMEGGGRSLNREEIMRGMENLQQDTGDTLDLQLYSLNLMATLMNLDMWAYVQQNATLFERGGLFYAIVERDLGLADGKHFLLPSIPNKKFTYNAMEDRIEICLEPIGHFPIRPGVDDSDSPSTSRPSPSSTDPEDKDRSEYITSVRSKLKAGGSGVVTTGGKQVGGYRAFSGHAHTLSSGGQRLDGGTSSSSSSQQQEGWEMPRWTQYQREFKKLLDRQEQQAPEAQLSGSGQSSEAVEMPQGSSVEQLGVLAQEPMLSNQRATEGQRLRPTTQEGLREEIMDSSISDSGEGRAGATDISHGTVDIASGNRETEQSKSKSEEGSTERDIPMEVSREASVQQRAPLSTLPMEVDSKNDNLQNTITVQSSLPDGRESISDDAAPAPTQEQRLPEGEPVQATSEPKDEGMPVYVPKRLGPGYTVLVEQTPPGASTPSPSDEQSHGT